MTKEKTDFSLLLPDGNKDPITEFRYIPDSFYSLIQILEPFCDITNQNGDTITVEHPGYCTLADRINGVPDSNPYVDIRTHIGKPTRSHDFKLGNGIQGGCCEGCMFKQCPYVAAALNKVCRTRRPKILGLMRKNYADNKDKADAAFFDKPQINFTVMPHRLTTTQMEKAKKLIDKGLLMSIGRNDHTLISFIVPGAGGFDIGENLDPNLDRSKGFSVGTISIPHTLADTFFLESEMPDMTLAAVYVEWLMRKGKYDCVYTNLKTKEFNEAYAKVDHITKCSENQDVSFFRLSNIDTYGFYGCVETSDSKNDDIFLKDLCDSLREVRDLDGNEENPYSKMTMLELSELLTKKRTTNGQDKYFDFGYDFYSLANNRVYVLTNLNEFMDHYDFYENRPDVDYRERAIKYVLKELKRYNPERFVVLYDSKEAIERFLKIDSALAMLFRENVFTVSDIADDELFSIYLECLDPDVYQEYHSDYEQKFLTYLRKYRSIFGMAGEDLAYYLAGYANARQKLVLPPGPDRKDSEFNLEKEMSDIIDMKQIKEQIRKLYSYATFSMKAKNSSLKLPDPNYHMVFTGNPGTGKTMIARIIARMLYEIGITKEDKLVEVERKDLVAEYVGQTAVKTAKVIDSAIGGVLFVDEAYSLNGTGSGTAGDAFGREAVATLIKSMEDRKGELVVIFAGYKKEMDDFLAMNPGIESRIGYSFTFEDYSEESLTEIFKSKIRASGFKMKPGVTQKVKKLFGYFCSLENFGNGRFVDKVIQNALIIHSQNPEEELEMIYPDDIPSISAMADIMMHGSTMADPTDLTKEDILATSIHEIGHAYVEYVLTGGTDISLVKVTPEANGTLGYVMRKAKKRKYHITEKDMMNELAVLLSGKNAESLFYGTHSSGCSSDMQRAYELAKNMAEKYAMPAVTDNKPEEILKEADALSVKTLEEGKAIIKSSADWLSKVKQCDGKEIIQKFSESGI